MTYSKWPFHVACDLFIAGWGHSINYVLFILEIWLQQPPGRIKTQIKSSLQWWSTQKCRPSTAKKKRKFADLHYISFPLLHIPNHWGGFLDMLCHPVIQVQSAPSSTSALWAYKNWGHLVMEGLAWTGKPCFLGKYYQYRIVWNCNPLHNPWWF